MKPAFRKKYDGSLNLADSVAAIVVKKENKGKVWIAPLSPQMVAVTATTAVKKRGGDPNDVVDFLGEHIMQFGIFRGQTFRWILENALGYAGYLAATAEIDPPNNSFNGHNKRAFFKYMNSFAEGRKAIELKRISTSTTPTTTSTTTMRSVPQASGSLPATKTLSSLMVGRKVTPRVLASRIKSITSPKKISPSVLAEVEEKQAKKFQELHGARSVDTKTLAPVRSGQMPAPSRSTYTIAPAPVRAGQMPAPARSTDTIAPAPVRAGQMPAPARSTDTIAPAPVRAGQMPAPARSTDTIAPAPVRAGQMPAPARSTDTIAPAPVRAGQMPAPARSTDTITPAPVRAGQMLAAARSTDFIAPAPLRAGQMLAPAKSTDTIAPAPVRAVGVPTAAKYEDTITPLPVSKTLKIVPPSTVTPSGYLHILAGWKRTLPEVDVYWISKALFKDTSYGSFDEQRIDRLWWYPPQPRLSNNIKSGVDRYFAHPLLLWMPRRLWKVRLICPYPSCHEQELVSAGIHPRVRQVLDVSSFYLVASEDLQCTRCKRKVVSWSHNIVEQLDIGHRVQFPCILTGRNGCDMRIVRLLRNRGLGNSCSQIQKKIEEQHSDAWLQKAIHYLTDCRGFSRAETAGLVTGIEFDSIPSLGHIPKSRWLMKVYIQDVLQRLDEIKASITSHFGSILKLDSTKKVVKKLGGPCAGTAMWFTNVGNEYGQIVMSVLTTHEGYGLQDMATGLVKRYSDAGMTPPVLLYVDRDCCGSSSVRRIFADWPGLQLRLDIWHFMRRISTGCTTDSHMLYAMFMGRLSHCIFKWDHSDLTQLKTAKRKELAAEHISNPSDEDIMNRLKRNQLALHCRRTTRGVQETTTLITQLIEAFDGDKGRDTLGVPLINSARMQEIWKIQKKHVACIQDPVGAQLYIQTGSQTKFGVELPTYRCARGSTSLECFHLHLNRFIPGTLANATLYQAYIVDGLARWNQDRAKAATVKTLEQASLQHQHSYSGLLRHTANVLSEEVLGHALTRYSGPRKYTGELIGLEYLYSQKDIIMHDYGAIIEEMESSTDDPTEDDVEETDEGFADANLEDIDDYTIPNSSVYIWTAPSGNLLQPPSTAPPTAQPTPPIPQPTPPTARPASPDPTDLPMDVHRDILPIPTSAEYHSAVRDVHVEPIFEDPISATKSARSIPAGSSRSMQPSEKQPGITTDSEESDDQDESVGPDNIAGYDRVMDLADYLVSLRDHSIALKSSEADHVVELWQNLSDYDRLRTKFPARHRSYQIKGRFKSTKTAVSPGVESTKRCVLGPNSGPAQWPDCNRYVEAVVLKLCVIYPGARQVSGRKMTRWSLIRQAYKTIRQCIVNNAKVLDNTEIQMPELNQATITQWHNKHGKMQERRILQQGIHPPEPVRTAAQNLPAPIQLRSHLPTGIIENPHTFPQPPNTLGSAKLKRRRLSPDARTVVSAPKVAMATSATQTSPDKGATIINITPASTPVLPMAYFDPANRVNVMPTLQRVPVQQQRPVPYSTLKYRERKMKEEQAGQFRRKYEKKTTSVVCSKCRKIRSAPMHQQYFGNWYCEETSPVTLEEWKASLMTREYGKKNCRHPSK